MTLYQQNVHDMSAIQTGLALLPMVITMMMLLADHGRLPQPGRPAADDHGRDVRHRHRHAALPARRRWSASYWDILPAFIVMGIGMSGIWAPMTTAVLNSVESEKSGVASAVNGAIREIGTAFGIAFLGTIMNRTYQIVLR